MRYPTSDRYVSSPYGWRVHPVTGARKLHAGTDFPLPGLDAPLHAVADFTVVSRGYSDSGGNWVKIRLPDGVIAGYYHMRAATHLSTGHRGVEGERVGYMGSSGKFTTGPHLHFETRRADGSSFDPVPYLDQGSAAGGGSTPLPEDDMFTDQDRARLNAVYAALFGPKNLNPTASPAPQLSWLDAQGNVKQTPYGLLDIEIETQRMIDEMGDPAA